MKKFFWHAANFFKLLWYVHIQHKCPVCKSRIIERDYPSDFVQEAKCSNKDCKWGWNK